jgi:hypothetical protein
MLGHDTNPFLTGRPTLCGDALMDDLWTSLIYQHRYVFGWLHRMTGTDTGD